MGFKTENEESPLCHLVSNLKFEIPYPKNIEKQRTVQIEFYISKLCANDKWISREETMKLNNSLARIDAILLALGFPKLKILKD